MDVLAYWFYKSVFLGVQWALLTPIWMGLWFVLNLLGGEDAPLWFRVPAIILLLCTLVATHWIAARAAHKHVVDGARFGDSLKLALLDGRLQLTWIPVIGPWFLRKPRPDR